MFKIKSYGKSDQNHINTNNTINTNLTDASAEYSPEFWKAHHEFQNNPLKTRPYLENKLQEISSQNEWWVSNQWIEKQEFSYLQALFDMLTPEEVYKLNEIFSAREEHEINNESILFPNRIFPIIEEQEAKNASDTNNNVSPETYYAQLFTENLEIKHEETVGNNTELPLFPYQSINNAEINEEKSGCNIENKEENDAEIKEKEFDRKNTENNDYSTCLMHYAKNLEIDGITTTLQNIIESGAVIDYTTVFKMITCVVKCTNDASIIEKLMEKIIKYFAGNEPRIQISYPCENMTREKFEQWKLSHKIYGKIIIVQENSKEETYWYLPPGYKNPKQLTLKEDAILNKDSQYTIRELNKIFTPGGIKFYQTPISIAITFVFQNLEITVNIIETVIRMIESIPDGEIQLPTITTIFNNLHRIVLHESTQENQRIICDLALNLLNLMKNYGVEPDGDIFRMVIQMLKRVNDDEKIGNIILTAIENEILHENLGFDRDKQYLSISFNQNMKGNRFNIDPTHHKSLMLCMYTALLHINETRGNIRKGTKVESLIDINKKTGKKYNHTMMWLSKDFIFHEYLSKSGSSILLITGRQSGSSSTSFTINRTNNHTKKL